MGESLSSVSWSTVVGPEPLDGFVMRSKRFLGRPMLTENRESPGDQTGSETTHPSKVTRVLFGLEASKTHRSALGSPVATRTRRPSRERRGPNMLPLSLTKLRCLPWRSTHSKRDCADAEPV